MWKANFFCSSICVCVRMWSNIALITLCHHQIPCDIFINSRSYIFFLHYYLIFGGVVPSGFFFSLTWCRCCVAFWSIYCCNVLGMAARNDTYERFEVDTLFYGFSLSLDNIAAERVCGKRHSWIMFNLFNLKKNLHFTLILTYFPSRSSQRWHTKKRR